MNKNRKLTLFLLSHYVCLTFPLRTVLQSHAQYLPLLYLNESSFLSTLTVSTGATCFWGEWPQGFPTHFLLLFFVVRHPLSAWTWDVTTSLCLLTTTLAHHRMRLRSLSPCSRSLTWCERCCSWPHVPQGDTQGPWTSPWFLTFCRRSVQPSRLPSLLL